MVKALVSMIVAAYNVEQYIDKCIKSIMGQTYKNIEIIIIDDGSTDMTGKICESYSQYKNIKVVHKNNMGLVAARKDGLMLASGEYIGFVDGDDSVEPTFVQELLSGVIESAADFIHMGYKSVSGTRTDICYRIPNQGIVFNNDADRLEFIMKFVIDKDTRCITGSIWSKLFKKEFITRCYEIVPDKQSYGEDIICLLQCLVTCKSVKLQDSYLYNYNEREGSMTKQNINIIWENELRLCNTLMDIKNKTDNSLLKKVINRITSVKMQELLDRTCTYRWKDEDLIWGKNIVIYGAGKAGRDYIYQFEKGDVCNIVSVIDGKKEGVLSGQYHIQKIETIQCLQYDYIIVAVTSYNVAREIKKGLIANNISEEVILWDIPKKVWE